MFPILHTNSDAQAAKFKLWFYDVYACVIQMKIGNIMQSYIKIMSFACTFHQFKGIFGMINKFVQFYR